MIAERVYGFCAPHRVSREHLLRHLAEFDYRYSTREATEAMRYDLLNRVAGRRLAHKPSTRRDAAAAS